jgi:hypothetical protein
MAGTREKGARPVIEEKKAVLRSEHREIILREEAPDVTREKIYIPDYVMQDFGFQKRTRLGGSRAPATVPNGRESF